MRKMSGENEKYNTFPRLPILFLNTHMTTPNARGLCDGGDGE